MPLQLSRLYECTKDSFRIELRGGAGGLDNMVNWVHLLENLHTVDFIRGSELILTTGMVSRQMGVEKWLTEFISALSKNGACGLVVNVGKHIDPLPECAISLCDELRFPIFTIPWEIHLVDIVRDFCNRIFESDQNEESVTKAFMRAIFSPTDREGYVEFLKARGYRPDGLYRVFIIREKTPTPQSKEWTERFDTILRNRLNRENKSYHLFRHEEKLVGIFPDVAGMDEASAITDILCGLFDQHFPGKDLRIGVGPAVQEIGLLEKTYRRAILALRFAGRSGNRSALFETMGLYRMLLSTDDTDLLREMLDENLGRLISYDEKNKSDNMEILRLYIQSNFSVQQVGQQTYMHRNTINYRVRKIKEILGTDLESMDEKLKCLLAFYIYDIMQD